MKSIAQKAAEEFERVFRDGGVPSNISDFTYSPGQTILDVLAASELVSSRSEGRRMIAQNGVRLDGETVKTHTLVLTQLRILNVGKHRWLRIIPL